MGYSATYDAVGNMTCRAPTSQTTCSGSSPTGAQLTWDTEGRLAAWQNTPTSPTTTANYLYDGAGQRVQQAVTVNGSITTTTTYVAGGLEESVSSGAGTTLTKYFAGGDGLPTLERVGTSGPVSVLASDGQGTVAESFDSAGNVTSAQLFTPYGVSRCSSGNSPTSHGYTGQVADSSTGLDYYHARYYDPAAGQFTSADTVDDGLNRYGYVAGNPTTATDPSGHHCETDDGECGNGGGSGSAPYLLGMAPETKSYYIRNADGTLTIKTTTRERYDWSDGRVTYGEATSSSQTECDAKCHHLKRAHELDKEAGKFAVGGIVFEALAAVMDFLTGGIKETLRAVFLIADILGNALPYIAQWAGASSGFFQVMYHISSIFNVLAGMAADALALFSTWGDLALGAASDIAYVIRAAAAGVPGLLASVAFKAVGHILGDGFLAASYLSWSQYDHLEEEAKQEQAVADSLSDGV